MAEHICEGTDGVDSGCVKGRVIAGWQDGFGGDADSWDEGPCTCRCHAPAAASEPSSGGAAMTPAQELRKAAAGLRELAERADTGERWEASQHYDALWMVDLKPSLGPVETSPFEERLGIEGCAPYEDHRFLAAFHPHAEYVAAMHPDFALAVADWLEITAGFLEDRVTIWGDQYALAVARSFLGTSPELATAEQQQGEM